MDTRHVQTVLVNGTKSRIGDCWLKLESNSKLHSVQLMTAMRPDMLLYSEHFNELTIPFEDVFEEAFERKKLKDTELILKLIAEERE